MSGSLSLPSSLRPFLSFCFPRSFPESYFSLPLLASSSPSFPSPFFQCLPFPLFRLPHVPHSFILLFEVFIRTLILLFLSFLLHSSFPFFTSELLLLSFSLAFYSSTLSSYPHSPAHPIFFHPLSSGSLFSSSSPAFSSSAVFSSPFFLR